MPKASSYVEQARASGVIGPGHPEHELYSLYWQKNGDPRKKDEKLKVVVSDIEGNIQKEVSVTPQLNAADVKNMLGELGCNDTVSVIPNDGTLSASEPQLPKVEAA